MNQNHLNHPSKLAALLEVLAVTLLTLVPSTTALAQSEPMTIDEIAPAPPEVGAGIPGTYFGPAPSEVQRELIGPYQLLKAGRVDQQANTVTLPLYQGRLQDGRSVWYVLTDTTDQRNTEALGLNFSAKLAYAEVGQAVRNAVLDREGMLVFENGAVDFSPVRSIEPGSPNAFPPEQAQPGSVGDRNYTPLVRIANANGHIYNAPIIAFDVSAEEISFPNGNPDYRLVHDKVVKIDPAAMTVTLNLTPGMSFARPVLYISFDSNDAVAATLEASTLAPGLSDVRIGGDDGAFSAVERLFVFANGPTGRNNPQRQGLNSAIVDGNGPINIFGGVPTIALDYSPLWDLNLGEWTTEAIDQGYRSRLLEEFQILRFVQQGWITGPNGAAYGSTGIIVNCPLVMRLL
ncbi:hypothetical protein [Pseudanabaena sp. FACHB-2040]|uniref:hypothetical protein n=1 Tax=Pseudanabaena sp. FACHB-2040 TaxID=2692859 RepID=UPI0016833F7F|nr:hypothetical protein [Pseudanabaena sp. FACHB-2040]MBD2258389.1 hypothetical protein [Pseudanabaena sp. FACHB-2040]